MSPSAELLWQLNRNYVTRLARAHSNFDLLERLLLQRRVSLREPLLSILQLTHAQLAFLSEEHHGWCYTYFYESAESKRMVQTGSAVRHALVNFGLMCERHNASLNNVIAQLAASPRPDPAATRVAGGDLWELMQVALVELVTFSNELTAGTSA